MSANRRLPFLTFRLAKQQYALPIDNVVEVAAMLALSHIPNVPQEILGIANRHGNALLMLDLRHAFKIEASPLTVSTLFIVAQNGETLVGLVVDEIFQVRYVDRQAVKQAHGTGRYIKQIISSEQLLYQVLDLQVLLDQYLIHIQ